MITSTSLVESVTSFDPEEPLSPIGTVYGQGQTSYEFLDDQGFETVQSVSMSGDAPTVSVTVIIPTFNRASFVGEAITSILEQTVAPQRILVVDDGSTDETAAVVQSFGDAVDYIHKENGGKSSALNLALTLADTDYIWIFDDDDVAAPYALQRLADALTHAPECGFSYGSYRIFTQAPDQDKIFIDHDFPRIAPERLFIALLGRNFVHQPGLLVRRSCYDFIGPFDTTLLRSQDFDMMLRLSRSFMGIEVEGPVFFQRRHAGIRGTATFSVRADKVESTWKKFDHIILRRLRETCELKDFIPRRQNDQPLTEQERFSALLERCTMVGRRGLWDLATEDLTAAIAVANAENYQRLSQDQLNTLYRFFDPYSDGATEFLNAKDFQQALNLIKNPKLGRDIRQGMTWPLPWRIREAAMSGQRQKVMTFLKIYLRIASPHIIALSLAQKLKQKLTKEAPP